MACRLDMRVSGARLFVRCGPSACAVSPVSSLPPSAPPLPQALCSVIVSQSDRSRCLNTYPSNYLLYPFLVTLHLEECLDLADGEILSVAERDELIKSAQKLIGIPQYFPLVQALAYTGHDLGEQVEGVDVLEDVRLPVGDEHHVEFVEGLVDIAHIVLLDGRMLGPGVCKLWKRSQKSFDSRAGNLSELSRQDGFPPSGAYRGG